MKRARAAKPTPRTAEAPRHAGRSPRLALAVTALFALALAPPAARASPLSMPGESRLETARERIAEQRFGEAIPLLQAELREHPENDDARLTLARHMAASFLARVRHQARALVPTRLSRGLLPRPVLDGLGIGSQGRDDGR